MEFFPHNKTRFHFDCRPISASTVMRSTPGAIGGYLFTDVETTGLTPIREELPDRERMVMHEPAMISQIASIIVTPEWKPLAYFMSYVRYDPRYAWSLVAEEKTGITKQKLEKAPLEKDVAKTFYDFANSVPNLRFAGYNSRFDIKFCKSLLERHDLPLSPWAEPDFDVFLIAKEKAGDVENFRLETLAPHFGIKFQGSAHDAMTDISATFRLAKLLVTGEENGL